MKYVIGIALGAAAGFLYYRYVGCATGSCPITSHPVSSILYGSALGMLIAGAF